MRIYSDHDQPGGFRQLKKQVVWGHSLRIPRLAGWSGLPEERRRGDVIWPIQPADDGLRPHPEVEITFDTNPCKAADFAGSRLNFRQDRHFLPIYPAAFAEMADLLRKWHSRAVELEMAANRQPKPGIGKFTTTPVTPEQLPVL
ncbi:hypothetical protein [Roseibium sp.]|uniref:hypothetical protein n=1 Tax=Roseibium sp. TaxID=1936156 RepID=UPI003D114E0B